MGTDNVPLDINDFNKVEKGVYSIDAVHNGLKDFPTYDTVMFSYVLEKFGKPIERFSNTKDVQKFLHFCSYNYKRCDATKARGVGETVIKKLETYIEKTVAKNMELKPEFAALGEKILNYIKFIGKGATILEKSSKKQDFTINDLVDCITAATNYNWCLSDMKNKLKALEKELESI